MSDRLLLGPGPSPVAPRVMRAMTAPVLSHLDPAMMAILDDVRARLGRVFHAADGAFSFAVSGTGTAGMETAIAALTRPGTRGVAVVNGYFGDRLAQMLQRYGADVTRVEGEWGRAVDPAQLEKGLAAGADVVTMVHAETSTGVLNPVGEMCRLAAARGARTIVDCVTSLGAMPVDAAGWGADAIYSCTQKGLGAPSGMAPVTFAAPLLSALDAAGADRRGRSFYFDLGLLRDYWIGRKYHHTISAPLVYALQEALVTVEEEGLEPRWQRHRDTHEAFVAALAGIGLELLPPEGERLWSLNAVRVPAGVDEAAVRAALLTDHGIEIGAGLGPLAGRIWRVGLMGSGSTRENVSRLVSALAGLVRR
ncbi:MAG TPA: alanine--glyoxylate aminotransferase family protein [Vicinamibacterales bacterium]|jgi:alanine-glyoxylate transaminase/serine-glyoxylate transaminase/serine-pyruvate transaminase